MLITLDGEVRNVTGDYTLSEYLATTDMEVVNQGTFCDNNKRTVIDDLSHTVSNTRVASCKGVTMPTNIFIV